MKKLKTGILLSTAMALVFPITAAAAWTAHDYAGGTRSIYLDDEIGAAVSLAVIGRTGEMSPGNTAALLASRGSCGAPVFREIFGVPGYLLECPAAVTEHLFDDGERLLLAATRCQGEAVCPHLGSFVSEFGRKGAPLPEPEKPALPEIRARMDAALKAAGNGESSGDSNGTGEGAGQ